MAAKKAETNGKPTNRIADALSTGNKQLRVPQIELAVVTVRIAGITPLIHHKWSEKALTMIRDKQAGKKTKTRDIRKPDEEGEAATYRTKDGGYGVPAMSIKSALIAAAHKDLGIDKTLVRKALFIHCEDGDMLLPLECDPPEIREDVVRVGMGSTDLRYRPYYHEWAVSVTFDLDSSLLQVEDVIALINRAGFGVGIGEWRPEKGGEFGRFRVDTETPLEISKQQV
ncbi:MAG: hypothetical protein KDB14_05400 [Planctomycetales bacterium]|nr:hypothetical protein [Planctomycetales bacterium]